MNNRIPRNFTTMTITVLSGNAKGSKMIVTKDDFGYHGRDIETGKMWSLFVSHLRNPHVCKIESIE